jgi:hypothetical protein
LQLDDVDSAAFEGEQKWDSRFERRVTGEEGGEENWSSARRKVSVVREKGYEGRDDGPSSASP